MVRTKKGIVASLTRWKMCWILDPYASWSSICVDSDLPERSFNFFISSSRILDGDMLFMISFWYSKDDVRFKVVHRLLGDLWNNVYFRPLHN